MLAEVEIYIYASLLLCIKTQKHLLMTLLYGGAMLLIYMEIIKEHTQWQCLWVVQFSHFYSVSEKKKSLNSDIWNKKKCLFSWEEEVNPELAKFLAELITKHQESMSPQPLSGFVSTHNVAEQRQTHPMTLDTFSTTEQRGAGPVW